MRNSFKHSLITFLFLILVFLVIIAGFNWVVDPFDIFNSPNISGFNTIKPEVRNHLRIAKAVAVNQIKPAAICLGTSRAEVGIDPEHPGWYTQPVYNLGLSMATSYEMLRYFQHANHIHPLQQVLLCLDFISFKTDEKYAPDFSEDRLSVRYDNMPNRSLNLNDTASSLISLSVIMSSLKTIIPTENTGLYLENGRRLNLGSVTDIGTRSAFIRSERSYANNLYLPGKYQIDDIDKEDSPYTCFRDILRIAYAQSIDLKMTINPCHVRQWEVLSASGLWDQFEDWKRTLVSINEEEAESSGKTPFPLWDFNNYNGFTTEPVPALSETTKQMEWFWDSSHYKKELGDLMLNKIFGYSNINSLPDNFGVLLNSQIIDKHLQSIRSAQKQYKATHIEETSEIEQLFTSSSP